MICQPNTEKFLNVTPTLVFEILSPATMQKDRFVKYELYQQAGVNYYVIVDLKKRVAEIYQLKEGEYERVQKVSTETVDFDLDGCLLAFNFSTIW